jgi:hypothetical protein
MVDKIISAFSAFNPISFAIQMVASAILSKLLAPSPPSQAAQQPEPNPGSRAQTPPAGDNKLPVIYGHAWAGGIITDLSITTDNQTLYYVFALSEVTNTETGGTPDNITFGKVYWGGRLCLFNENGYTVTGLKDESTGEVQDVNGYMDIYLYRNGSNSPAPSPIPALNPATAPASPAPANPAPANPAPANSSPFNLASLIPTFNTAPLTAPTKFLKK